ncbi:hypothetical protein [Cognatishimia sp. F0-27]|uniref:hypothetical protein n=1 Tax=Cognatishimia sp. F0-27 TaxID=2816855 RepID=UPI001D0C32E7|nr:hypothetical protein [Cognatishimia sp. F0-27]MCC1492236.1 hypothetical protein [Cognatishimia sp. F0-27]
MTGAAPRRAPPLLRVTQGGLRAAPLSALVALVPAAARADACATARPFWDAGTGHATILDEALHFAASPATGGLLLATALAWRLRSARGGLAVVCGWSLMAGIIAFGRTSDAFGVSQSALEQGCVASPALFIGVVAAICIATVLYTAPDTGRSNTQE